VIRAAREEARAGGDVSCLRGLNSSGIVQGGLAAERILASSGNFIFRQKRRALARRRRDKADSSEPARSVLPFTHGHVLSRKPRQRGGDAGATRGRRGGAESLGETGRRWLGMNRCFERAVTRCQRSRRHSERVTVVAPGAAIDSRAASRVRKRRDARGMQSRVERPARRSAWLLSINNGNYRPIHSRGLSFAPLAIESASSRAAFRSVRINARAVFIQRSRSPDR